MKYLKYSDTLAIVHGNKSIAYREATVASLKGARKGQEGKGRVRKHGKRQGREGHEKGRGDTVKSGY